MRSALHLLAVTIFALTAPAFGQTPSPPADPPGLSDALAAGTDLWGERAMREPGGPTYAFFERLLPPLRYVDTPFRHYPIALAAPLGPRKARVVSNGSGINLPAAPGDSRWHNFPLGVTVHVGAEDEVFGSDLARLQGPTFDRGYLPIVQTRYQQGDAILAQELFVPIDAPFADHAAVFVRLTAPVGKTAGKISLSLMGDGAYAVKDGVLLDADGKALLWLGDGWTWDAPGKRLAADAAPGQALLFAVFSHPLAEPSLGTLDAAAYDDRRAACAAEWEKWLGRCMTLDVPEDVVNRAWRAVVIANLMMATGDEMSYSSSNAYHRLYEAEAGDAVRAMMTFGLIDLAKTMTNPLLRYKQQGLDYHDAGFKLQLLSHVYWLTRDAQFIRDRRDLWQPAVDRIINDREKETGILPKEDYAGDIKTPVYSLNSNANACRGLRDVAAVLRDIGEKEEADRIGAVVAEFRRAILAALDKSECRDAKPPFIPIALFGAEKPYETITASVMGTYWNLLIPYVLTSGILDDARTQAVLDTLHTRGGICMGMTRIHQHSGLFANENAVDDLYAIRYVQTLLRRDDAERALVTFYGKLAQGFTRDTFVGGEGTGLIPLDPHGRPMYLPPNAAGNGLFLTTLREMLVQDQDLNDDGEPETLRLLFATPRAWLDDGKTIRLERAPTAFGPVSVIAKSALARGEVTVDVKPPARAPASTKLRVRLPEGWVVTSAAIGDETLDVGPGATLDVSAHRDSFTVRFAVKRE